MSGAEAGLVLGLISSTIAIFEAADEIYDAAHDAKGLPKKFRAAADEIPLVLHSLSLAQDNLQTGTVSKDAIKSAKPILESCKASAESLKDIFDQTMPSEGGSRTERYKKAAAMKVKGSKVTECVQQVAKNMELLAQHQVFQDAQTIEDIRAAIEELDNVDHEEGQSQSTYGSGDIINQSGSGTFNKRTYHSSDKSKMYAADTMHVGGKGADDL